MQQALASSSTAAHQGWLIFVYRAPSEPSSSRVAIWRDLKRIGGYYLQQCVCIVPDRADLRRELEGVRERVSRLGGSSYLFTSPPLAEQEQRQLIEGFRALAEQQYAEIVEECETKFVKEVEFEHFRRNYSFAEAEEIEQDFDKIRRWFARVQERDWFGAPGREEVERWIERCAELLEEFFAAVHRHAGDEDETSGGVSTPRLVAVPERPKAARRRRGT
ncbi:MAG TPA: Chromate resistance protein ChrB [Dehalococcoidia bacterium]|jgi:hypothetical protein|nr:Chromate resistance protein ChrB [Dehalococcoidia bacterium]